ncbi:hypothetical protein, partial [Chitinolyticbacter albus]|uniref:hypothetical protein n=1 Tax=Chitinolyticbacter albus TaxID=2961951 RepID=UPI002109FE8B
RLLAAEPEAVLLEVGPGNTLSGLVRQLAGAAGRSIVNSVRHVQQGGADGRWLAQALGRLWVRGVSVDWAGYFEGEERRRVPLPTYPFQRQRYWVARRVEAATATLQWV